MRSPTTEVEELVSVLNGVVNLVMDSALYVLTKDVLVQVVDVRFVDAWLPRGFLRL